LPFLFYNEPVLQHRPLEHVHPTQPTLFSLSFPSLRSLKSSVGLRWLPAHEMISRNDFVAALTISFSSIVFDVLRFFFVYLFSVSTQLLSSSTLADFHPVLL
jgi:hypothetical protein